MKVTQEIDDDLCKSARHKAADDGLSVSGWVANLIHKEVSDPVETPPGSLLEALGTDILGPDESKFNRDSSSAREIVFD